MQYSIIRKPSAELNIFQSTNFTTSKPVQGDKPAPGKKREVLDELLKNWQVPFTHHTDAVPSGKERKEEFLYV